MEKRYTGVWGRGKLVLVLFIKFFFKFLCAKKLGKNSFLKYNSSSDSGYKICTNKI